MKNKPIYKLVDGKGRVLIPKSLRDAAKLEYGDIVRLGLMDGKVTVRKVDVVEAGDQSRRRWKPMCVLLSNRCQMQSGWN